MADTRTYIRVHDGMPDHPKVDGLSDRAFRLLVEEWCWCSRHTTDGRIPGARWKKRHTPKARTELIAVGLVELLPGGDILMHDYLEHQRSAEEIADAKASKSKGASLGNHKRWHTDRGIRDPSCDHCTIAPPISGVIANGSVLIASTSTETEDQPSVAEPPVDPTKVSQSASAHEASRWLHGRYGLTDQESARVVAEAHRRAKAPIRYLVPYLDGMAEGDLADIVRTIQDEADRSQPTPAEPVAEYVPPPPGPPPAEPDGSRMSEDQAREFAHRNVCNKIRCPRCADIRDRWPDHERPTA